MKIKLAKTETIHFVGIGGIGMSGLAIIMNGLGFQVQGSDISYNRNIERLKKYKIKVFIGHKKSNIFNTSIVVISSAIKNNNPEILASKNKKLPIYKRGEMLGHIVSLMKNIVISGSHGKTTTTSLISSIFSASKIDPTVINGGVLNSNKNSASLGKSSWCILESDESDGSFLNIPPTYSIVTNIDKEHLDYYKNFQNLKKHFIKFIEKTPSFGKCFICIDDKINSQVIKKIKNKNFLTYGLYKDSNFRILNILQKKNLSQFDLLINLPGKKKIKINKVKIPIIGVHNVLNATAALAISYSVGIPIKIIKKGLIEFKGVQRRFNFLFDYKNSKFIDDYAHHPTEINSVLKSIKLVYKHEKIFCIFQPHRISRVNDLREEFTKCFKYADTVILCPIFSAGEKIKLNFNYTNFAKDIIRKSSVDLIMIQNEKDLLKYIKQNIFGTNIVIGLGAGSISNWLKILKDKI